jgi:ABC-type amino acid transport substrate-binding protein
MVIIAEISSELIKIYDDTQKLISIYNAFEKLCHDYWLLAFLVLAIALSVLVKSLRTHFSDFIVFATKWKTKTKYEIISFCLLILLYLTVSGVIVYQIATSTKPVFTDGDNKLFIGTPVKVKWVLANENELRNKVNNNETGLVYCIQWSKYNNFNFSQNIGCKNTKSYSNNDPPNANLSGSIYLRVAAGSQSKSRYKTLTALKKGCEKKFPKDVLQREKCLNESLIKDIRFRTKWSQPIRVSQYKNSFNRITRERSIKVYFPESRQGAFYWTDANASAAGIDHELINKVFSAISTSKEAKDEVSKNVTNEMLAQGKDKDKDKDKDEISKKVKDEISKFSLSLEPDTTKWSDLFKTLGTEQDGDLAIGSFTSLQEREDKYGILFSNPYYRATLSLVGYKSSMSVSDFNSQSFIDLITDKKVGVQKGSTAEILFRYLNDFLKSQNRSPITIISPNEGSDLITAIKNLSCDFFVADSDFILANSEDLNIKKIEPRDLMLENLPIKVFEKQFSRLIDQPYAIAVRRTDKILLSIINKEIDRLEQSGELDRIITESKNKYSTFDRNNSQFNR